MFDMSSFSTRILLTVLSLAIFVPGLPVNAASNQEQHVNDRILVQPKAGLSRTEFSRILQRAGAVPERVIEQINLHIIRVPVQAEEKVRKALSQNPHINFAERDQPLSLEETTANDPYYSKAWHLQKMQAPLAWDNALGNGVTVAVLDTGVDPYHPDLSGKLVPGRNAVDGTSDTSDIHGHGTQVAGVIGAISDNGIGVTSLAWNTVIMPVRVSNAGNGAAYPSDIAAGLAWAADNGASVANISYNVTSSAAVSSAAQYMMSKGGIVVVAAGNNGSNPGYKDNPDLISVSATSSSDTKTSWSNYGNYVDVAAPGAGIWTTKKGGGYGSVSGTSFSSPATAAVVALVQSVNYRLSPQSVIQLVEDSADDLGSAGWDSFYGHGRVNAAAAVQAALMTDAGDHQAPTAGFDSPTQGQKVSGIVPVSVIAQDNVGVTKVDLLANGRLVASVATKPYSFSWDTRGEADGSATLVAYAHDAAGNQGSRSISVNVANTGGQGSPDTDAPQVRITTPGDGSTVSGTVGISATASDDTGIARLDILVDGNLLCSSSANGLSCNWNSRKASSGVHTISAQATDRAGKTAMTAIQVTKAGSTKGRGNGKKK